ncbi:Uncharacterized protein PFLU_2500 [Pseudomonas [fluorescens] SBW25]|uniref:Uncharacterized protein n=1 Tax=Pseudomonas fluorescens (strain SBW25) TaxID=216595 RepID=C3K8R7_PSEFS|nr:Uncharacterized protein PFLU_2500 [Pseudomonas fluorescens SBW25]
MMSHDAKAVFVWVRFKKTLSDRSCASRQSDLCTEIKRDVDLLGVPDPSSLEKHM